MKTILVPTDFSDNANNALHYAAAMARQAKGKIIIVHAIDLQVFSDDWGKVVMRPDARLEPFYYEKLNQLAAQIRREHGFTFIVEMVCVHGALIPHLRSLVQRKGVDLVVMGTQGANTLGRKVFGTQTATFIREASCPVLAIPAQTHYQEIKTIVYASDLEREESLFLNPLHRFIKTYALALTVLNIKTDEQLDIVADHQVLEEIKAGLPATDFKVVQMQHAKVVAGIWEYVNTEHPDVLAISLRQRDFLETILHDSVSEKILYQHQIPLLTLPEKLVTLAEEETNIIQKQVAAVANV